MSDEKKKDKPDKPKKDQGYASGVRKPVKHGPKGVRPQL